LIEACVYPQRRGRSDLVAAYQRSLLQSRQVRMLAVDASVARKAVVLRAQYVIHVPDAVQFAAALEAGRQAEIDNIAMYDRFLLRELPADVRQVFVQLKAASQNHLRAFTTTQGRSS